MADHWHPGECPDHGPILMWITHWCPLCTMADPTRDRTLIGQRRRLHDVAKAARRRDVLRCPVLATVDVYPSRVMFDLVPQPCAPDPERERRLSQVTIAEH